MSSRLERRNHYMRIEAENITDSSVSVEDSSTSSSPEESGRQRYDLWVYLRRNWGIFPLLILLTLALAFCSALFGPNIIVKITCGSLGWAFACLLLGVMMQVRSQPLSYYEKRAMVAEEQRRKAHMFNNFTSMNAPTLEQRQKNQLALIRSTTLVGAHHAAAPPNLLDCEVMYSAVSDAALLSMRRTYSSRT
uniref:SAYSvFN domain-containing protein n=1 Tax=Steinernema glaseri TaxID=37863 RepID=A0A1I7ZIS0_9BILA